MHVLKITFQTPSEQACDDSTILVDDLVINHHELEILKLIGKGRSNKEIALDLHLTAGTVKNYVSNILTYLNLRDRVQVAIWVAKHSPDLIDL